MKHLTDKAAKIKLVVFDVDGVLTDGCLYFTESGEEIKTFTTLDGQGIKMLHQAGIATAIITGRQSQIVNKRARDLKINHLYQGREDKIVALKELLQELAMAPELVCYVGDDLPDLAAIQYAGLGIAVANAHSFVVAHADGQTVHQGGRGAAREVCDFILEAQGQLETIQQSYLQQ